MVRLRSSAALALVLALSAAGSATAQDTAAGPRVANNTFFVELGGNAVAYSLNYERFFTPKIGIRIGGMYLQADDDAGTQVGVGLFPVMATYLLGAGNSHFETGAGIGFATAGVSDSDIGGDWGDSAVYGTATFGYRYQKPEGGVMFRAGFTPVFADGTLLPWVGVSVGYAF
jgi:hypothetical protein